MKFGIRQDMVSEIKKKDGQRNEIMGSTRGREGGEQEGGGQVTERESWSEKKEDAKHITPRI
jgi:hypothetical protein